MDEKGRCLDCFHLAEVLANGLPKCGYGSPFGDPNNSEETYLYAKVFPEWFGCIKFKRKE